MSLPGVESARRRRVSHGRSSIGYVQPPPLRRRSNPHPSANFLNPSARRQVSGEVLDEGAIAARHRLDARLRAPDTCRSAQTNSRQHTPPLPGPLPQAREKRISEVIIAQKLDGRTEMGGAQHDDCPVCLESFLGGQMIVNLPCLHTFHSKCIVPWLQNRSHCPSCRANVCCK